MDEETDDVDNFVDGQEVVRVGAGDDIAHLMSCQLSRASDRRFIPLSWLASGMTSARVREACLTDTVRSQAWDYGHAGLAADVDHSPESARLHVGQCGLQTV